MQLPYPFVPRLPEPAIPGESYRVERGLAGARVFLAVASLTAIWLDPTEPTRFENIAYILLTLYLAHSIGVFVTLTRKHEVNSQFCIVVQAVDLLCPVVISVFTEGPNSPFFVVFFFAIMEAAFRWGFLAAFYNTIIGIFVQAAEVAMLMWGPRNLFVVDTQFEANRVIIRAAYLVITGLVIGYAAEQQKQLRAEDMVIARIVDRARTTERSLSAAMHEVFQEILQVFRADRLVAISNETLTGRVFCWTVISHPQTGVEVRFHEPNFDERDHYRFEDPSDAWYAERKSTDIAPDGWQVTGIGLKGRHVRELPPFRPPETALGPGTANAVMGFAFRMGNDYEGHVLLRNPQFLGGVFTELRFGKKLLDQVGSAIYNLYLIRRLRSRAGAIERARAARELHDGAIQSLIAAEMQVDVLRRRAVSGAGIPNADLERIQEILRHEVLGLRELMQEMRPIDVGPRDLLESLSSLVDRFRRDTGISARFATELEEVTLTPRACREVVRITQEALFNVRRHSGAKNVMVRFNDENGLWKLRIEDDGRGFQFQGSLTGPEMESSRQGPLVIRERVRHMGGELVVESTPGKGARLEIALPHPKARAIYA